MSNKTYSLVAWTEDGEVRMIPSLINECSLPYRQRIASLESQWGKTENEVGLIIAQSRAHEDLARFFLRVGRIREAYQEYENAAEVCAICYDDLWVQGDRCDGPMLPLYKRFLAMHSRCLDLVGKYSSLRRYYEGSHLQSRFLWFTLDTRNERKERRDAREARKAWRFGSPF